MSTPTHVIIDHPHGQITAPYVALSGALAEDGAELPLSSIPFFIRNGYYARTLIRLGLAKDPWEQRTGSTGQLSTGHAYLTESETRSEASEYRNCHHSGEAHAHLGRHQVAGR